MMLDDFIFGAASSAYQIEGAWNIDGKQPSIWDEISHNTKWVKNNHTGDIACDHYHQYIQDVGLMKNLGLDAYRFSISWSRICTQKCMCTNLKGIKFYQNLVNELKKAGIEPFITLYHWDLPKWLNDIGGWSNPESIEYFKCYAETMMKALPEVKYWITFNEPAVFIHNFWGHNNKTKAIRNVLLSHGTVAELAYDLNKKIGIALNLWDIQPAIMGDKKNEIAVNNLDKIHNRLWLDPILGNKKGFGYFPDGINKLLRLGKNRLQFNNRVERQTVCNHIDFLGINYYSTVTVRYNKHGPPGFYQAVAGGFKHDEMGVEIRPNGLLDICERIKKDYCDLDLFITENGCAYADTFVHGNKIHDDERIDYIREHLRYCKQAVDRGIKLKGYFYWSLMDNFEWLQGYNKRFGLLYVFYPTQSRVCKDSYFWYQKIIGDDKFREKELKNLEVVNYYDNL